MSPNEAGFAPEALDAIVAQVDAGVLANVHALLIERRGHLVFERYWSGDDEVWGTSLGYVTHGPRSQHDIRSVTKSITSLLLGIALGDTAEDAVQQPLASFFPDRAVNPALADVTLHHVLTMTAGLDWNEMVVPYSDPNNDEIRLSSTEDPVGLVLERPLRTEPGSAWYYNGGLTQLVAAIIERLTERPLIRFAEEALFDPLGLEDFVWMRPYAWPEDHAPSAASGLRLRAPDLAKIGSLVLSNGAWQGRQVVPASWIALSTQRHVDDTPWGPPGAYGYGYFWFPGEVGGGQRVLRAVGNGDQRLFVLPELGLSVTVLAGNYNDFGHAVGERILAQVLGALS